MSDINKFIQAIKIEDERPDILEFRVNTPGLLKEIGANSNQAVLVMPLNILKGLFGKVAKRAAEINDKELNKLMIMLSFYEVSNPESKQFDPDFIREYLSS